MAKSKILKENLNVRNLALGFAFLLSFLWVINPPARTAIGINLVFLMIAFVLYSSQEYQDDTIGITLKNSLVSISAGVLAGFVFLIVSLFVPGMSIGIPVLPASISDNLKFFLVVFVAPIVETIFFQGALYAYVSNFDNTKDKKYKGRAIFLQAVIFSLFHLGAYVSGFYMYPGFTEGMTAVFANISSFFVAFLFALIAGYIVTRNGIKNLIFCMVFHLILNLIAYSLAVAVLS